HGVLSKTQLDSTVFVNQEYTSTLTNHGDTPMTPSSKAARSAPAALFAVAFALAGCGDDSVNPSNPDAGPSKDATTDGEGGGGEGGHEGGGGGDASAATDAGEDGASHADASEASAADASDSGSATETGAEDAGDASPD